MFTLELTEPKHAQSPSDTLATARRDYAAAKQRALYWSGNPTSIGRSWSVLHARVSSPGSKYIEAMKELKRAAAVIERLTGKRLATFDPQAKVLDGQQVMKLE